MGEAGKKRVSGWKILGMVVGGILGCVLALYVWVGCVAERRFDAIDAELKAMIAQRREADGRRPVLRGQAQPGNAADDYALVLAAVKSIKDANKVGSLVDRSPKGDPELGKAVLAASGPALDLLRQGAARESHRYPHEWEKGASMDVPGLLQSQITVNVATLKGRSLAEEGKPGEAAALLLDALQFGRDVGDDGVVISAMIGSALINMALNEIRELLTADKFDAAALRDLDAGLAILDDSFPSFAKVLSNESLLVGVGMRDEAAKTGWGVSRMFHVNAYEGIARGLARAARAEALSWAEAQREMADIQGEANSSWNPLVRLTVPSLLPSSRVGRERQAQLRLLRTAVHYKATGEVLELKDPFGGRLGASNKDGALKVWSVGRDGVDDGGAGGWKTDQKDIVLDVKK